MPVVRACKMLEVFQGLEGRITGVPVVRACKMLEVFQGLGGR